MKSSNTSRVTCGKQIIAHISEKEKKLFYKTNIKDIEVRMKLLNNLNKAECGLKSKCQVL